MSPQLTRNVERFSGNSLALIGVVSLIAGGIGIAGAVVAFVDRKRRSIRRPEGHRRERSLIFRPSFSRNDGDRDARLVGWRARRRDSLLASGPIGSALDLPFEPVVAPVRFAGILTGFAGQRRIRRRASRTRAGTPVATLFRLATSKQGAACVRLLCRLPCCFAALVLSSGLVIRAKIALAAMAGVLLSGIILRVVAFGISRAAARRTVLVSRCASPCTISGDRAQ